MSTRRMPGEVVKRKPGSGMCGSAEPKYIRVPEGNKYLWEGLNPEEAGYDPEWPSHREGEAELCNLCEEPKCRQWANLEIVEGEFKGGNMCHISECEMEDYDGTIRLPLSHPLAVCGGYSLMNPNSQLVQFCKAGALMRIADATELMARNHEQLVRDAENCKRWYQEEKQRRERYQRSNAALRGIIKRMKRLQESKDDGAK